MFPVSETGQSAMNAGNTSDLPPLHTLVGLEYASRDPKQRAKD